MYKNVELRKLPAATLCNIATILETNNDWKKVMSLIPRNPRSEHFELKYTNEHIKQIEDYARTSNRKCSEILFEEWGTSGRIRPTLSTLKDVVQKAEIFRAADEIAIILQEPMPDRPEDGPAAKIDTNITLMMEQTGEQRHDGTTVQMRSTPNLREPKSLGKWTTAQMKSEADLIKFSAGEPSMNVPDFSALDIKTQNLAEANASSTGGFQMSLPNIDLSGSGIDTDILKDENLIHFEYKMLEKITKRFSERLIYTPGQPHGQLAGKIGSGGFGEVFVGYHADHGHLAVKKAHSNLASDRKPEIAIKVFNAEVKFLSRFNHKNIVPIIGFSRDGPTLCVVCEYIDGGSLEQKIGAKILTEQERIDIMIGTAEGLKYLHKSGKSILSDDTNFGFKADMDSDNSKKNNFVHGDVKTANILLTRDYVPKLCDFGLAKQYDSTFITTSMMGTSAYMAPEGFNGTITQKIDIYSFGIVLLELLTGQKPLVVNKDREKLNIKDYVEENCINNDITRLLDPFAKWSKAKEIYSIARSCLERQRKSRPTSEEICEALYKINDAEPIIN